MQIQISAGHVPTNEALVAFIQDEITKAIGPFEDYITHVGVHLNDLNGPKSGVDKRCVIEANLVGRGPLAVNYEAEGVNEAIHLAAEKFKRIIKSKMDRIQQKKGRASVSKVVNSTDLSPETEADGRSENQFLDDVH